MIGWFLAIGLALIAAAAILLIGRLPRPTWELVGAALLLGVAGYAWQGNPGLAGAPRKVVEQTAPFNEQIAEQRRAIGERFGKAGQWLIMSDAMGRRGQTADAANILVSGLKASPNDANLWVGLGNALVAHGDNILSPSAEYSYRRAMMLDPDAPAAPYFYGLALARSGQLDPARKIWAPLAAKLPEGSELHTQLQNDLAAIDRALAQP